MLHKTGTKKSAYLFFFENTFIHNSCMGVDVKYPICSDSSDDCTILFQQVNCTWGIISTPKG